VLDVIKSTASNFGLGSQQHSGSQKGSVDADSANAKINWQETESLTCPITVFINL
jgi:hypothetical protein